MTIGERIKAERLKINMPQATLGEYLKLTQQAVGRWEKDLSEPDTATLKKLADLFGVSVDYLIGHDEITPEERTSGASETKKISLSADEYELIMCYREIGRKRGADAQRALTTVAEKML